MPGVTPRISIAICTYDRYDVLPKAIDSATNQSIESHNYRILVVDNSADHERARAFGARYKDVVNLTYIVQETPGLSNARNVSSAQCGTEFIAFMDDDAIASRDWLKCILFTFETFGPETMIVGGRVDPLWGAPRPPWLHDAMITSLSVIDWGGEARVATADEWFAGTNISFRTKAILDHGGFATNLGRIGSGASLLSNEEVQLLERIRAAGGRLVYAPDASVKHLVEPNRLLRSWFRKRSAWQAVSDYMMDPKRFASTVPQYWEDVLKYFNALPPYERTVRGMALDTDDPDFFRWQLGAIYNMTIIKMAGYEGVNVDQLVQ
ncbi:MAG: glycosyltransferase [Rhodospirillales bacterium]|nr:glycosyltransferase [Rhodospirillales bacterium]